MRKILSIGLGITSLFLIGCATEGSTHVSAGYDSGYSYHRHRHHSYPYHRSYLSRPTYRSNSYRAPVRSSRSSPTVVINQTTVNQTDNKRSDTKKTQKGKKSRDIENRKSQENQRNP
jgi:hypothetical protein